MSRRKKIEPTLLEAGDVVLMASGSIVGRLIRWFTRSWGEKPTLFNHAGIMVSGRVVCEALDVVRWREFEYAVRADRRVRVWRRRPSLSTAEKDCVRETCLSLVGRHYAAYKLVFYAIDGLLGKLVGGDPFVARRLICGGPQVCGGLVALVLATALGYYVLSPEPSPDDLDDWFPGTGDWVVVYDGAGEQAAAEPVIIPGGASEAGLN